MLRMPGQTTGPQWVCAALMRICGALDAVLLFEPGGHFLGDLPRDADQIGGEDDHPPAAAVLDHQGFRPEVLE